MIDLEKGRITIGKRDSKIQRYEVWWAVPRHGLFDNLADALEVGGRLEIESVAVAVGEGDVYELLPQ